MTAETAGPHFFQDIRKFLIVPENETMPRYTSSLSSARGAQGCGRKRMHEVRENRRCGDEGPPLRAVHGESRGTDGHAPGPCPRHHRSTNCRTLNSRDHGAMERELSRPLFRASRSYGQGEDILIARPIEKGAGMPPLHVFASAWRVQVVRAADLAATQNACNTRIRSLPCNSLTGKVISVGGRRRPGEQGR
jgi:hypothetical protein